LKALGQHLVYIHGQHQHLKLLKPEIQLDVLDGYGQLLNLRAKLNHLWLRHQANQTALQAALENQQRQTARRELLAFQIQELTEAQLKVGENEALTQEFDWLSHQTDYQQQIVSITEVLYDDEGIEKILASQSKILAHLATQSQKPELHNAKTLIESADIQLKEARCDLTTLLEQFEMDPERFNTIEVRLGQLYELGRKYKVPPQDLPQLLNDLNQEYQTLTHQDDLLTVLQAENLEIETAYQQAAAHLSSERKHAAHTLCAALNSLLPELRLPDCQIQIQLTPRNPRGPSPTGNESVLFLIRTHAHLDFHPMNQGISGGELSRIALAVHVVCSTVEGTPSLIFDEVDVGIGGGTAEIVGRLLRRMGHHTQVLCITHLAQVAAQAQHHLCVQKTQLKDQLYTAVIPLQGEARIQELARMIGGVEITQQTLLHATELYALAQKQ
jgi:DNA repair protein RecN (Recombination protein N)